MRQFWTVVFVLALIAGLSWRTWRHRGVPGTTTIDLSLPKALQETGLKVRLRIGDRFVDLVPGRQELETQYGENELRFLCPGVLVESHVYRTFVENSHDALALGLACKGEIESIYCEVTTNGIATSLDMVSCNR
ncbi:MAG: hypothetical protein JWM82_1052 [Myxococcales bacterium]|nr:hypothetical protein [Myxococcales bacterium]